jgi:hypothetical protein
MTIKHCFIITSAINTRFGVYTPADRLLQTVITIRSIKQKVPAAKIVLVEMAGLPFTEQQAKTLTHEVDVLLDFTDEPNVKSMYESTDNWDIVKNGTEIMVFGAALKLLVEDGELDGVDRVHKISGRYVINDMFDPLTYEQSEVVDSIVFSKRKLSQFPYKLVMQEFQFMSRLWSWPSTLTDDIVLFYDKAIQHFTTAIAVGQYIDIEHLLFKFLHTQKIHELDNIGIEGLIGPNGQAVKD